MRGRGPQRPVVLAIVGPTGTGKTELACAVARRIGGEIIGCDSMQVYRGMDVGTAKPSAALRAEIPHHGIDLVDPDDPMSAGRYAELARAAARGVIERGGKPILCGGTGLYARAFAGGLISGIESSPVLRAELERRSTGELRRELEALDPESAARIGPRDRVRTVRALEAWRLGQRPLSAQQRAHGFADRPFEVRWLGLDLERGALAERLRARVDGMFEAGLVEEVRRLHAAGFGPELRALQSIGYREVGELLAGRLSEAQARERIALASRRYSKRQRTWFRAERELVWCDATRPHDALERALGLAEDRP